MWYLSGICVAFDYFHVFLCICVVFVWHLFILVVFLYMGGICVFGWYLGRICVFWK